MRTIVTTMLALLAISFAAPHASALSVTNQCNGAAGVNECVFQGKGGFGDCKNGFQYGYDDVFVNSPAGFIGVYGAHDCFFGGNFDVIDGYAYTPAGGAGVYWVSYSYGSYNYCDSGAYTPLGFHDLGCPAGAPPNPGWGSLLP